jgi:hypothetical protein
MEVLSKIMLGIERWAMVERFDVRVEALLAGYRRGVVTGGELLDGVGLAVAVEMWQLWRWTGKGQIAGASEGRFGDGLARSEFE